MAMIWRPRLLLRMSLALRELMLAKRPKQMLRSWRTEKMAKVQGQCLLLRGDYLI
jgi:hypothetical protein